MGEVLGRKYPPYDDILTRITHNLITDKDFESFGKMVTEVYEAGYMKAIDEYREQLAKLNIRVNISQRNAGGSQT